MNCSSKPSKYSLVLATLQDLKGFQAMKEEFQALMDNKTLILVEHSHLVKIVGNK